MAIKKKSSVSALMERPPTDGGSSENELNHRTHLIEARQKAYEDFDKTLLALSGGALGVSITFVKDILGGQVTFKNYLVNSWILWVAALIVILFSYFMSRQALDLAIDQLDSGLLSTRPGGWRSVVTQWSNVLAAILFVSGLIYFILFAYNNLEVLNAGKQQTQSQSQQQSAAGSESK